MSLPDTYVEEEPTTAADTQTSTDTNDSTSTDSTYTPIAIDGTDIELDYMTITMLDGWQKMDIADRCTAV